jgi:PAS domain-containing protein
MTMDFDAAINAHFEGKSRLTEYLLAPAGSLSEAEAGRDDLCELGTWLNASPPMDDTTLQALTVRYSAFHTAVAAVVARAHAGDRVAIETLDGALSDVGVASASLIGLLRAARDNVPHTHVPVLDPEQVSTSTRELDWSSEAWAKAIFAESPLGMSITESHTPDPGAKNERYVEITGRTRAELIGADWQTLTHPDDLSVGAAVTR